jgi:hypothetical protein
MLRNLQLTQGTMGHLHARFTRQAATESGYEEAIESGIKII